MKKKTRQSKSATNDTVFFWAVRNVTTPFLVRADERDCPLLYVESPGFPMQGAPMPGYPIPAWPQLGSLDYCWMGGVGWKKPHSNREVCIKYAKYLF